VKSSTGTHGLGGTLTLSVAESATTEAGTVSWSYKVDNTAVQKLALDEVATETFTVTVSDGKGGFIDKDVTISVIGTNDAPVIGTVQDVTFVQGGFSVVNLETVKATDIDTNDKVIKYSLASTFGGIFAIDEASGQISLTKVGASKVAAEEVISGYDLVVTATDEHSGASTPKTIHVTIDMAVDGRAASLPGSINDWTVAPVNGSKDGFMFTSVSDPTIQVHIPATVTKLEFTSGGSLGLSNNGTLGRITDTTTGMDHKITIAAGTTESDMVVLSTTSTDKVTVIGQADAAGKMDIVKFDASFNINKIDSYFVQGATTDAPMTLKVGSATAIVSDVEAVHFAVTKVLIVGAGGYASLTEASAAATGGEVIYVAHKSLADGVNGVINHSDISIYIANGDGASMKLADNLVTTGEGVRIYGNHSFTLTGTSGADTIHDYTNLTAGLTNNILGMDGADNLVSHSNDLGTHILTGGSGADILVGGKGAQLLGGDGDDKLLAFGGAALLSGGAGNDVLLNAYGSADGTSTVNMIGGSGSDTFGLISSTDTSQSGTMRTVVTDLGTGDKVDLSFVESVAGRSINTVSDFTGTSGKATMTTSGTTLAFGKDTVVTNTDDSSPGLQDVDSHVAAGTMILSNATLTKASTAINAADITSVVDFNNTFGHLTDTYNHHG
jgi:VCBS repeat-containing protein